jgi:glycosyltransferase involved in cell wall biosynthesis
MKIAIFGARGVPGAWSGFDTFVTELAPRLAADGNEVSLYCMPKYTAPEVGDQYEGVDLVRLPTVYGKFTETVLHEILSSLHSLFQPRQDIYYVLGCRTVWAYLPHVLLRRRLVINTDGMDWLRRKWGPVARAYLKINYWMARHFSRYLVCDAKELQKFYLEEYGKETAFLTNGGYVREIEDESRHRQILAEYGVEPGSYYLVACRMEPENNVDIIVREFGRSSVNAPLLIAGGANYESQYLKSIEQNHDPRIRFLGPVYTEGHIEALHLGARGYLHGHEVGGTNPSLLKAMGCGNLILAHDIRFNREVLAGNGILWTKEPGSLAAALERAEGEDAGNRAEVAESCRERIDSYYSWDKVAEDHERYFRWIMGLEASYSDSF